MFANLPKMIHSMPMNQILQFSLIKHKNVESYGAHLPLLFMSRWHWIAMPTKPILFETSQYFNFDFYVMLKHIQKSIFIFIPNRWNFITTYAWTYHLLYQLLSFSWSNRWATRLFKIKITCCTKWKRTRRFV